MLQPLHCIALRTVRHTDRHSILTVYTAECGRVSLLLPSGSGKSAARYRALTMPMAVFECVADIKPGREIHPFRDLKADNEWVGEDFGNPVRSVMAFFLADFFSSILREPTPDRSLYGLVRDAAVMTARTPASRLPNLHLSVMVRAARLLGIEPDVSTYSAGSIFDMEEGVWHTDITRYGRGSLDRDDSAHAALLARMTALNFHRYRFNRHQRRAAIEGMLRYFSMHGFGRMELGSLEIIHELFD